MITELVINHTSDKHPWFQRARRAPPGTAARDFYVWSDTPNRYAEARIPDGLPFLDALSAALPPDATLLTDSLVAFWLDRLHAVPGPRRLRFPWGTGTLGFGLPAAVVPVLTTDEGVPVGVQVIGRRGREDEVLGVCRAIEERVAVR